MVVNIAIKGGLGNQLFQYALGGYLKQKFSCSIRYDILPLDIKQENLTARSFLLDRLFSDLQLTTPATHRLFYTAGNSGFVKLYKKISRALNRYVYISETGISKLELKTGHTYYLDGYWQNAGSAALSIGKINACTAAALKSSEYLGQITEAGESVAIHIRRGDYISNPVASSYHGHCGPDYYLRAMALIESRISVGAYFIFSDDLKWAKEHIKSAQKLIFVAGDDKEPVADLFLMKSCRHQVISNSSFSCWASYLNTNPAKIVVAPLNWTKKEKTNSLPISENKWILI